jgi:hypothetical protein
MTEAQAYLIAAVSPAAVLAALVVGYCTGALRERRRHVATLTRPGAATVRRRRFDAWVCNHLLLSVVCFGVAWGTLVGLLLWVTA